MIFNLKSEKHECIMMYYVSLKPNVVVQNFHPWRSMIQKLAMRCHPPFLRQVKVEKTEFASSRVAFEAFPMKAEVENLIGVPVMNQALKGTLMATRNPAIYNPLRLVVYPNKFTGL